jgi:hypothetical protein
MTCCSFLPRDFTQTDPLQPTVGQAYPSTYVYGNNNPTVYTDPSGMRSSGGREDSFSSIANFQPLELALVMASKTTLPACTGFQLITFGGVYGCKRTVDERGPGLDFSFRVNPALALALREKRADVGIEKVSYKFFRVTGPDRDEFKEVREVASSKRGEDVSGDPLDYEFHTIVRLKFLKLGPTDAVGVEFDAKFKNSPTQIKFGPRDVTIGGVRKRIVVRPA